MPQSLLELLVVLIAGMAWGSFATMAVYRIPRGLPWIGDKPHCFSCGHELNFLDYLSIASYFLWKGRCRYCNVEYGARSSYLATEIAITGLFLACYLRFGLSDLFVLLSCFIVAAVVLGVAEAEHRFVPVKMLLSLLFIGAIYRTFIDHSFYGLFYSTLAGLIIGVTARYLYFRWMGDRKTATDYLQWQDQDRFSGPGFDYVKLMGVCGTYLPIHTLLTFSLVVGAVLILWKLLHPSTLRPGAVMMAGLLVWVLVLPL